MNDVTTGPESESQAPKNPVAASTRSREPMAGSEPTTPPPMVQCPCCAGTGRVGLNNAACQACWMRGVVASWRMHQLLHDMNYWRERYGEPRRGIDESGSGPEEPDGPCEVCDPFDPCMECPKKNLSPLSLAA
jgi:hypothetical protein